MVKLPNGSVLERYASLGVATNNVGEPTAIGLALDLLDEARFSPRSVSRFVRTRKYVFGLLELGWKAKSNQDLVLGLRNRLRNGRVQLHWVAGHVGIAENERADELANQGVAESMRGLSGCPKWLRAVIEHIFWMATWEEPDAGVKDVVPVASRTTVFRSGAHALVLRAAP